MKKTIIKTALITLISVIALLIIAYFAVGIFSPLTIAKFYDKAGSENLSIKYYEKQYNKTKSINDLVVLCEKIDVKKVDKKGNSKAEKYLSILVNSEDYKEYCDNNTQNGVTSKEFFEGQYVLSVYYKSGIDSALEKAKEIVLEGYTSYSPYYVLICENGENLKQSEKEKIFNSIGSLSISNEYTARDLSLLG